MALTIIRALEEEGTRKRSKEVVLKAPVGIVNYLFNQKREHLALIEARYAMSVRIEADPSLISPDYSIEKLKTATRVIPDAPTVISGSAALMGDFVEEDEDIPEDIGDDEDEAPVKTEGARAETPRGEGGRGQADRAEGERGEGNGEGGKKKRRRRRRRRGGKGPDGQPLSAEAQAAQDAEDDAADAMPEGDAEDGASASTEAPLPADAQVIAAAPVAAAAAPAVPAVKPKSTRTRASKAKAAPAPDVDVEVAAPAAAPAPEAIAEAAAPVKKTVTRSSRSRKPKSEAEAPVAAVANPVHELPALVVDPGLTEVPPAEAVAEPQPDPGQVSAPEPAAEDPAKPKRKGWWSLGR
jgi:ribonuclease E